MMPEERDAVAALAGGEGIVLFSVDGHEIRVLELDVEGRDSAFFRAQVELKETRESPTQN